MFITFITHFAFVSLLLLYLVAKLYSRIILESLGIVIITLSRLNSSRFFTVDVTLGNLWKIVKIAKARKQEDSPLAFLL